MLNIGADCHDGYGQVLTLPLLWLSTCACRRLRLAFVFAHHVPNTAQRCPTLPNAAFPVELPKLWVNHVCRTNKNCHPRTHFCRLQRISPYGSSCRITAARTWTPSPRSTPKQLTTILPLPIFPLTILSTGYCPHQKETL